MYEIDRAWAGWRDAELYGAIDAYVNRESTAPLETCRICFEEFDGDDLKHGICEECAKDLFTVELGKKYVLENFNNFMDFIDGIDIDSLTESEEAALLKEFCFDEFDHWRDYVGLS